MTGLRRVLILGGTAESLALARQLPDWTVFFSLAGRTSNPALPRHTFTRRGGFGGISGLIAYLRKHEIVALVNATHPFTRRMGRHASTAAWTLDIPMINLIRPAWKNDYGWISTHHLGSAAAIINRYYLGRNILLSVGSYDRIWFHGLDCKLYWRTLDEQVKSPGRDYTTAIYQKPPFDIGGQVSLLKQYSIDVLVSKNSGAIAVEAKLAAAVQLGIEILMIERPSPPSGVIVESVNQAKRWLREHG